MNYNETNKFKLLLDSVFQEVPAQDQQEGVSLADLGNMLFDVDNSFSPSNYGASQLRDLLDQVPDVVKIVDAYPQIRAVYRGAIRPAQAGGQNAQPGQRQDVDAPSDARDGQWGERDGSAEGQGLGEGERESPRAYGQSGAQGPDARLGDGMGAPEGYDDGRAAADPYGPAEAEPRQGGADWRRPQRDGRFYGAPDARRYPSEWGFSGQDRPYGARDWRPDDRDGRDGRGGYGPGFARQPSGGYRNRDAAYGPNAPDFRDGYGRNRGYGPRPYQGLRPYDGERAQGGYGRPYDRRFDGGNGYNDYRGRDARRPYYRDDRDRFTNGPDERGPYRPIRADGMPYDGLKRAKAPGELFKFAYCPDSVWEDLAHLAAEEYWGEAVVPNRGADDAGAREGLASAGSTARYTILFRYIKGVFCRAAIERKVLISKDDNEAAFHTGLLDDRGQPIYGVFTPNTFSNKQPWFLKCFCAVSSNLGKGYLDGQFDALPSPICFANNPSDLIFNAEMPVSPNWQSVARDNAYRLPEQTLTLAIPDDMLEDASSMGRFETQRYKNKLGDFLFANPESLAQLVGILQSALLETLKKAQLDYKIAVPTYYIKDNTVSLALPLDLTGRGNGADVALVLSNNGLNGYRGETIYPLSWAYGNARIISPVASPWLRAAGAADWDGPDEA